MGNLLFRLSDGKAPRMARRLNANAAMIFTDDLPAALPMLPPPLQDVVKALPEWADQDGLKGRAYVRAVDPITGRTAWQVPQSHPSDRAGMLVTASDLVIHGTDTGALRVLDARTGQLLKQINIGTSIVAAPATYRIGNTQYIAVAAAGGGGGWGYPRTGSAQYQRGNEGRLLVFKLDGKPVRQPPLKTYAPIPAPPAQAAGVTPDTLAKGHQLFMANCAMCHSNQTGSNLADLRRMTPGMHAVFDQVLLDGLLLPLGMPRWDDALSRDDVQAIHAYLIDLQGKAHAQQGKAGGKGEGPAFRQH
jgi:quinohemoprotein ethanol dehydrogenase